MIEIDCKIKTASEFWIQMDQIAALTYKGNLNFTCTANPYRRTYQFTAFFVRDGRIEFEYVWNFNMSSMSVINRIFQFPDLFELFCVLARDINSRDYRFSDSKTYLDYIHNVSSTLIDREWLMIIKRFECDAANRKAKKLLMRFLSQQQLIDLNCEDFISVRGRSDTIYQVTQSLVRKVDPLCEIPIVSYCIHPKITSEIPGYDYMLAAKLFIETDEDKFLSIANSRDINILTNTRLN